MHCDIIDNLLKYYILFDIDYIDKLLIMLL